MLLLELALQNLPAHVLSLRNTLLINMGYSLVNERKSIEMVKTYLANTIPTVFGPIDSHEPLLALAQLEKMSGTVRSEISYYIRQRLTLLLCADENLDETQFHQKVWFRSLSMIEFEGIRDLLVTFNEFPVLADIISFTIDSSDRSLLGAATDTVNWHFDVFRAIGAADELFEKLLARSTESHRRASSDIPLLLSLVDLGEQLQKRGREVSKLRKEAQYCEERPALAACSPVSDHVAEVLESSGSAFVEEMEQLLNSGNSMDKQTLSSLLGNVTKKVQKTWSISEESIVSLFGLLAKLRSFDDESFDTLLLNWLDGVLYLPNRPKLGRLLVPLVCSETMDLPKFMKRAISSLTHIDDVHICSKLAVELLALLTYSPSLDCTRGSQVIEYSRNINHIANLLQRTYRFRSAQTLVIRESPSVLTFLIYKALEPDIHQHSFSHCNTCAVFSTTEFSRMLQAALVYHEELTAKLADYLDIGAAHRPLVHVVDRMLAPLLQRGQ